MALVIVILAFLGGALLAAALAAPPARRDALAQRIEALAARREPLSPPLPSPAEAQLEATLAERLVRPGLRRLARLAARCSPGGAAASVRQLLNKAGNPAGLGVAEFLGLRVLSVLVFVLLACPATRYLGSTPLMKLAVFGFSVLIGVTLPDALLQQKIAERQRHIRKSLPDTIDLLIVSVEAGVGFDAAVARVTEKMRGPLADEFRRVQHQMRLGKTRGESLRDMAVRVDVPELTAFVAAVAQAEQLGVSMARVLRAQSETVRAVRLQRLREAAAKLPVKMVFPLVFLIFPALLVVLLGPALMRLFRELAAM